MNYSYRIYISPIYQLRSIVGILPFPRFISPWFQSSLSSIYTLEVHFYVYIFSCMMSLIVFDYLIACFKLPAFIVLVITDLFFVCFLICYAENYKSVERLSLITRDIWSTEIKNLVSVKILRISGRSLISIVCIYWLCCFRHIVVSFGDRLADYSA